MTYLTHTVSLQSFTQYQGAQDFQVSKKQEKRNFQSEKKEEKRNFGAKKGGKNGEFDKKIFIFIYKS